MLKHFADDLGNTLRETERMGCRNTTLRISLLSIVVALFTILSCGALAAADPDYMAAMGIVRFDGNIEAPNFSLPTAYGKTLQLHAFKGRVVLLNFWATW